MEKSKVILFLLFLVLLGCKNSTSNFPEEFVPGEVAIKFIDTVKEPEAKDFIENLGLEPIDLSKLENEKHPNWTLIGVFTLSQYCPPGAVGVHHKDLTIPGPVAGE